MPDYQLFFEAVLITLFIKSSIVFSLVLTQLFPENIGVAAYVETAKWLSHKLDNPTGRFTTAAVCGFLFLAILHQFSRLAAAYSPTN